MEELTPPAPSRGPDTSAPARPHRTRRLRRWYAVLAHTLHRAGLSAAAHGCFNLAQSTAYSAIVALFPALIVAAAVVGLLPDTAPVRFQLAAFFDRVLPPGVTPLLDTAFENSPGHAHSLRALITAGFVSFLGATNIISTLMEGLRRARNLPLDSWNFWQRRRRTFELVFLSLIPLAAASLLVVFGHAVTRLLVSSIGPESRAPIYMAAVLVRWTLSFAASVGLIGLIYHLGVPDAQLPIPIPSSLPVAIPAPIASAGRRSRDLLRAASRRIASSSSATFVDGPAIALPARSWRAVLPGAVVATALWFFTTLAFGWYVTRFADYSQVYGSLGAVIALLFWLYIVSLSVLCGAEFNAQFDSLLLANVERLRQPASPPPTEPAQPVSPSPASGH